MDEKPANPANPSPIIYVNPNKKYGLIFNNKTAAANKPKPMDSAATRQKPVAKPCIFDDEDDDDDGGDDDDLKTNTNAKKPQVSYQTESNRLKKQTQIEIEKALKEDPTAFEYDSIYDKLEEQKAKVDPKAAASKEKSNEAKYVPGIMKAAARRQMEFEKYQDKKLQKEREAEGDLWKDKEVFVTSSYKKRIEERQRLEEEERRQEQIEALLDVRKQKDLSGFYYSMLKIKTGELVIEEEGEKEKRLAKEAEEAVKFKEKVTTATAAAKQKSYRTAKEEDEREDENEDDEKKKDEKVETEGKEKNDDQSTASSKTSEQAEVKVEPNETKTESRKDDNNNKQEEQKVVEVVAAVVEEKTSPKISKEEQRKLRLEKLFKKRTVGEVFDRELAEYFLRKNQALSLKNFIERE